MKTKQTFYIFAINAFLVFLYFPNFNLDDLLRMESFLKNVGIKELYNFPSFFKNSFENSDLMLTFCFEIYLQSILYYIVSR